MKLAVTGILVSSMKQEGKGWDEADEINVIDLLESFYAALTSCTDIENVKKGVDGQLSLHQEE